MIITHWFWFRDLEQKKRWFVVVDGDRKLKRWVRAEARRRDVQATLVLDFIHALEYLWKAGHAFHAECNAELEAWVLERLEKMLEGGHQQRGGRYHAHGHHARA